MEGLLMERQGIAALSAILASKGLALGDGENLQYWYVTNSRGKLLFMMHKEYLFDGEGNYFEDNR